MTVPLVMVYNYRHIMLQDWVFIKFVSFNVVRGFCHKLPGRIWHVASECGRFCQRPKLDIGVQLILPTNKLLPAELDALLVCVCVCVCVCV